MRISDWSSDVCSSDLDIDYAALAEFRFALRRFQRFSETKAGEAELTPQQHQALLAIRAADPDEATVGYVAQRLIVKPHTASELLERHEATIGRASCRGRVCQ